MDGDLGLLSIHLFLNELLNVDAPSAAVNFSDFALTVFVGSTDDLDSVTIANRDGAGLVLGGELLAKLGRHHSSADGRGGGEVCLAGLSALAAHT